MLCESMKVMLPVEPKALPDGMRTAAGSIKTECEENHGSRIPEARSGLRSAGTIKKEKSRSFRCAGAQERAWQPGARGTSGGEMCESGCEFHEAA